MAWLLAAAAAAAAAALLPGLLAPAALAAAVAVLEGIVALPVWNIGQGAPPRKRSLSYHCPLLFTHSSSVLEALFDSLRCMQCPRVDQALFAY